MRLALVCVGKLKAGPERLLFDRYFKRLADGAAGIPGFRLAHPVEANGVFGVLRREQVSVLQRDWNFHVWADEGGEECVVRWMTAFDTPPEDVDAFVAAIRATAPLPSEPGR